MGTWSISPSSDIASIDSSTGEATFGNHTSDVTYTISYNDSTCGTITKSFTVHKCGTPSTCTCSDLTVNGKTIESEGGTNITIGTYSTTCVTNIGASADKEWVTITSTSGGVIKATVGSYGGTTDNRTATITVTGTAADESSSCSKPFTLTQKKQGGGGCDCNNITVTSSLSFGSTTNLTQTIAYTPTDCSLTVDSKPDWIESITDNENGTFTVKAKSNSGSRKEGVIKLKCESVTYSVSVSQEGGSTPCQYPGQAIQIMLTNVNTYQYYYLTNEIIGTNCSTWVETSGHKYLKSSAPLSLGYYQYDGCTMTGYDVGENYYCNISTPGTTGCNGSNMPLQANKTYYLYGYDGTSFTQVRTIVMPDGETAQSGADTNKYYEV